MDYLESAFIDAAVKYEAFIYAAVMRNANAFGDLPFILHPKDMVLQFTAQKFANMMSANVVTNFITKDNAKLFEDFMKKHNTTGKYPMNYKDFSEIGNGYSQVIMKMNCYLGPIYNSVMADDGQIMPKGTKDKFKEWFIKKNYPNTEKFTKGNMNIPSEYFATYLSEEHSDWVNSESFFETKDKDGNYIFANRLACGQMLSLSGDLKHVPIVLSHDKISHLSKEEIDAYEKKLGDEKYFSVGSNDDPYLINQFKKKYADFMVDKKGNYNSEGMQGHVFEFYTEEEQEKFTY